MRPFRIEGVWVEVLPDDSGLSSSLWGIPEFRMGWRSRVRGCRASGLEDSGLNQLLGLQ